jgi:hypothetical protein
VLTDTGIVLDLLSDHDNFIVYKPEAIVAYNEPNVNAIVNPNHLINIRGNQMRGGGFSRVNRFKLEPCKVNKVVRNAPIGCAITDKGPLAPGLIPVSDNIGRLVAFCGRSMQKDTEAVVQSVLDEYVTFAKQFIDKHLISVNCRLEIEPDEVESFVEQNKGKKSAAFIANVVKKYIDWRDFAVEDNRFTSHSCFVKDEDSYKSGKVKPRNIGIMSGPMHVGICPIAYLIHDWQDGTFSQFHTKSMVSEEEAREIYKETNIKPETMISKVIDATMGKHVVTDYSSYEASFTPKMREVEDYGIIRLCEMNGWWRTRRNYKTFVTETRKLKGKGYEFECVTRLSGDLNTSNGNGTGNVTAMAFAAHKLGNEPIVIAEGDDGVIPADHIDYSVLEKLGLEFSSKVEGVKPGDCDFLSNRWIEGRRYLNVGKCMRVFWVRTDGTLKSSKCKYLLRCSGASLHHLSPGHPILFEIVNRIGRMTAGMSQFKSCDRFIDSWKSEKVSKYPINITVDEEMRQEVANGSADFPGIPIAVQLVLEERLRDDNSEFYLGTLLNDYVAIQNMQDSSRSLEKVTEDVAFTLGEDVLNLLTAISMPFDEEIDSEDFAEGRPAVIYNRLGIDCQVIDKHCGKPLNRKLLQTSDDVKLR